MIILQCHNLNLFKKITMIYILPIILSMCHLGLMGSDNVRLEDFQEICANTNTSIDKNLTTISFLADCHLT
jgi:hypothetical protein